MTYKKHIDKLWVAAGQKTREKDYWLDKLSGELVKCGFPVDYKKAHISRKVWDRLNFRLSEELSAKLIKLSAGSDVRMHIILTAGLTLLLHKYTGYNDIILGSPILKPEVENEFINTILILRNTVRDDMPFREFLQQVKQTVIEAGENRNYPIEVLMEQLNMPMGEDDFPLFDVALLLQNIHDKTYIEHLKLNMSFSFLRNAAQIEGQVEYNSSLYERPTIERTVAHFKNLMDAVLTDTACAIIDVDILYREEKQKMLFEFNDTGACYQKDKTLQYLFEEQVGKTPDNPAVTGYQEGQVDRVSLTYSRLDEKSGKLARCLVQQGVKTNDLVAILVDRSVEMIIGLLAILKTGCGYVPLNPAAPVERTKYMLTECAARRLLTTHSLSIEVEELMSSGVDELRCEKIETVGDLRFETIFIDDLDSRVGAGLAPARDSFVFDGQPQGLPLQNLNRTPAPATSLAYVIFTSGSTGKPKGVAVTHANLSPLLHWGFKNLEIGFGDRTIQNLSYYFDWSVWEIFITLTTGACLYPVSGELLLNLQTCIEFIIENKITILHITPTQYRYLLGQELKLETLRYLFIGAEKLTFDVTERSLTSVNENCRVFNMYGPTEATIIAAVLEIDRKRYRDFKTLSSIPIGKPIGNTRLFILDRYSNLCPVGVTGELCISGDGITHGYLNNPELTAEKFLNSDVGARRAVPEDRGRLYKTGDLARWLPDGNIEFGGRIDSQVKIRGYRIELGEIETRVLEHKDIKNAVVVVRQYESGENYLCAYIVSSRNQSRENLPLDRKGVERAANIVADLREFLSGKLPDYMIPSYFETLERIPLTPNGKIDTNALPAPAIGASGREYYAPGDEVENKLVKIWSSVLGIDDSDSEFGIDDNFFEMGGHSLKATTMVYRIYKELAVNIDIEEVFSNPTIRELARRIKNLDQQEYIGITPVEKKEYYKLSYAQRRLWVLCQFEEDSTAYNMPSAVTIAGRFDVRAFEYAVQTLAEYHDSLRTIFILVTGDPRQKIIAGRDFKPDYKEINLCGLTEEVKEQEARKIYKEVANRVFNLEQGPLFCFRILRLEEEKYFLFYNIHHIVNDGWSQGNINNEIIRLYNSFLNKSENPLSLLYLQYKDYTLWHNDLIESGSFNKSREYWLEKFSDKPNGIDLPLDHSRKPVQTFNGGRVSFTIDAGQVSRLHKLSLVEDATLFMALLSLLAIFLAKYTGQEDIIIGAPIAARKRPELYSIVGFLVNTLVYRSRVNPGESFVNLLSAVKKETLACFEYQDYPFDLMIEELGLDRDLSQSPVFNVMLAHNNADTENIGLAMEGITISDYAFCEDFNMSKFDLIFFMDERDDHVFVRIEYNSDLFERSTIERMANNFPVLVDAVIRNKDVPLSNLDYIGAAEYKKIISAFNDNQYEFSALCLQEFIENRVEKIPGKTALVGIVSKDSDNSYPNITYRDLNCKANRLAHYLREEYRVKPNDVIGISMDRSIDMIIVLLSVVKSGAGYLAIDPTYPQERVLHVLTDSNTNLLIIDKMRPELFADYKGEILDITRNWGNIGQKSPENPTPVNTASDILYVNYTSGSTGTPNGAMLSHDCLTNLVYWQNENTSIDCSRRVLQFTSINFCVSFQEIMGTLTSGGELHLIGDIERQDIDYLLDFLSEHRIEILFLPFSYLNFLFNESGRWDRSFRHNLKHIITAGEQLKITTGLKRFLDLNPELQLHNHYGSTEMHVVTSYTLDASTAGQTPIPPAGKPVNNVDIFILDEYLNPVPIGVWGEIFVKGSLEILGYIKNDPLTEEKLIKHPEFSADGIRLYRSGDLGRWHVDGNIELRGRKDFQVKIRGFRIEPGEIESNILAIGDVRECVVVVKEDKAGQKRLVAYVVLDNIGAAEIKKILSNDLPQYMLPQFVVLEHLPLMPNGKVDREKLPEPELETQNDYTAPRDRLEAVLTEAWSEILSVEKDHISIDGNFFELGGHSLKATLMVSKIQEKFDRGIPLTEIFKTPTIKELAAYIRAAQADEYTAIEPAKQKDHYPLSAAQKRLFILNQMEKDTLGYNMPIVVLLEGKLERDRFIETFRKLIDRHESLRTSFYYIEEEPVQRVHNPEDVEFEIEYFESVGAGLAPAHDSSVIIGQPRGLPLQSIQDSSNTIAHLVDRFIRPFDLSAAPLLRTGLIALEKQEHILMVDMHHIISDGTSLGIITGDFMALYSGKELTPLRIYYKDYCVWQNRDEQKKSLQQQGTYWQERFAGEIPVLDLPTDYPRPAVQSFAGRTVFFEISPEETVSLNRFALEQGATLYMVLLAVYNILLTKLSGREDIIVGAPTAGRRHVDLQGIIGMFINTLSMRNFPAGDKTFRNFLQEVKTATLEAFENQDYQFEDLIEKVQVSRDVSRNPLFDVMFALQNMEVRNVEIPGLKLSSYEYENRTAKFDMTLQVFEVGKHLSCSLEYCVKLFNETTIHRYMEYFKTIVASVLQDPGKKLSQIEILPEVEKKQILFDFNDTGPEYPAVKTLHGLFAEQALKTPGSPAVLFEGRTLTYRELDEKTGMLAALLVEQGVKSQDLVGLLVERSVEMIIGILGILKAGCGYVPLNPTAPAGRTKYMLTECAARRLLTTHSLSKKVEELMSSGVENLYFETTFLDDLDSRVGEGLAPARDSFVFDGQPQGLPLQNLHRTPAPATSLAYVIFTSGSTGLPKGVPVSHANLSPLLHWGYRELGIGAGDRTIQNLSYYFDWSVWEIFITLTTGAGLYVVPDEILLSPEVYLDFMAAREITILHITPTQYQYLVSFEKTIETLKYLFIGAEKLTCDLIERGFASINASCRVFNMYGPTEAAIISAALEIKREEYKGFQIYSSIPIGKPVGNTGLLVLNKYLKPCPVNVTGELYITGDGLARGYLNNPELTAEKFIDSDVGAGLAPARDSSVFDGQPQGLPLQLSTHQITNSQLIYRTGDLARWLPQGYVEFLGRIDYQVKIRGFRIEPGEIEERLFKHEQVKEAVVIDRENEAGEKYLCAYFVVKDAEPSTGAPDAASLREYLALTLPGYMIPAFFIQVEKITLTPNGKLDRKSLPTPGSVDLKTGDEYVPPRTKMEKAIACVWQEVLGLKKVGIHDKYFDIGGNSLNIIRIGRKLNRDLGIDVPVVLLFRFPTIGALANYLDQQAASKDGAKKRVDRTEKVDRAKSRRLQKIDKRRRVM